MSYKFPPGAELGARMRPGVYYATAGGSSTAAATLNRLSAVPIFVPRALTVDRIAVNVTVVSGSSGSVGRVGIYNDINDAYGGLPGTLIADSASTVATNDSGTGLMAATVSVPLTPGLYWLAFVAQTAAPTCTSVAGPNQVVGTGASSVGSRCGYVQDSVTGALPSTFSPSTTAQGSLPQVQVRIA